MLQTQDEDSEAEKLSPLLDVKACADSPSPSPPVIAQEEGEEQDQLKVELPKNSSKQYALSFCNRNNRICNKICLEVGLISD